MRLPRGKWLLTTACAGLAVSSGAEFAWRWEGMYRVTRVWLRTVIGEGVGFMDAVRYLGSDALAYLAPAYALACALFGLIGIPCALVYPRHPRMAAISVLLMLLGLIPGRLLWTGWLEGFRYVLLALILLSGAAGLLRGKKKRPEPTEEHFTQIPDRHQKVHAFSRNERKQP